MRRKSFPAWLAILALSLQALWPLLAHAKPAQAPHLVPLCTVDGTTHFVELPAGGAPAEEHASTQHCKLCVFGGDRASIAPAHAVVLHLPGAPAQLVAIRQDPVVDSFLHSPARPRAPPAAP